MGSSSFTERFLNAYRLGIETKSRKERDALEKEQAALHREQVIRALQRQAEDDKLQATARGQQDAKLQLDLARTSPPPRIPVGGDGVGPEQLAPVEPVEFPTYDGRKIKVMPQFQDDIVAQALAQRQAQKEQDVEAAVAQETAISPIRALAQKQANQINPTMAQRKALGLPLDDVPIDKEVVNTGETIFAQRQQNARNAADIAARAEEKKASREPQENIDFMADQWRKRNLDITGKKDETVRAMMNSLRVRGLEPPRTLTLKEKNASTAAAEGYAAVQTMRRIFEKNPGVVTYAATPTNLGRGLLGGSDAQEFNTARSMARDPRVRDATGAAAPATEMVTFDTWFPQFGDKDTVAEKKIRQAEAFYGLSIGAPAKVVMPNGQEFDVPDGFDKAQRAKAFLAIDKGGRLVVDY